MRSVMIGLMAGAVSVSLASAAIAAEGKINIVAPPAGLGLSMPIPDKNWTPVRNAEGHVSLENNWTNATITPLERRDAKLGLNLTKAQQDELEGKTAAEIARGNANTKVDATVAEVSANADCSGGRGTNCNYNAAWTDPGSILVRVNGQARSSMITSTANGRIPPRVGGQANLASTVSEEDSEEGAPRRGARPARRFPPGVKQNDNPEGRSLGERCIMSFGQSSGPVMTNQLYNNTYQFVQGKDAVAIQVEMVHDVRVVRMGAKHRTDGVRPWMGDSIGHWEGDTLVVETTGFNPQQATRGGDENQKVTERFTRLGKNRLLYQFIVEDPTYWEKPWAGEYEFVTAGGPVYEYACHEGNYGLQNILAGAREEEREAAATGKPVASGPQPYGVGSAPAVAAANTAR